MDLGDVMSALAARLKAVPGLDHTYDRPVLQLPAVPAAVVSYPERLDYEVTYANGTNRMALEVWVFFTRTSEQAAHDKVTGWADPSGSDSVKAVLESGTYTAFDFVVVQSVEFARTNLGGTEYAAAVFTLDIVGSGE